MTPPDDGPDEPIDQTGPPSDDPAAGQPDETEPSETSPAESGVNRTRVALIATGVVVVLALIVGAILTASGGDDPVPATPSTTTTAKKRSTTTTIEQYPAGTSLIATAKESVTTLKVLADPPAEWETATAVPVPSAETTLPPSSQEALPVREELPTIESPIQGRSAVADGWEFSNPGPYDPAQPFTMLVTQRHGDWLKVLLPLRPNQTEGYVALTDVELSTTQKRITINITTNTLTAYDGPTVVAETPIVDGSAFTHTPTGRFYITDIVPQKNPAGAYGPYALATNGYSEMMDEFDTGVPVIAIHGTNAPEKLGTDVSNGCIRIPNDVITQLAESFPLGTPVYITP